jgi:hypothetical protein
VALATATYYAIERPFRSGRLARHAPWLLTGGLVLAAGLGWQLFKTDGLLDRYPAALRPIAQVQVQTDYAAYRIERCFLRSEQGPEAFAEECVDRRRPERPLLLLWGDSHAAALYPGLEVPSAGDAMRVAQFTASACPPGQVLATAANPHCDEINRFVLQRIHQLKPSAVVLAANWSAYTEAETGEQGRSPVAVLGRTIEVLHSAGVRQVIVFGPLPLWHVAPPNLLLQGWRESAPWPELSDRVLDAPTLLLDRSLELGTVSEGARYVSPMRTLCEPRGCRLWVPDGNGRQAIAFDSSHLTAAGSRWLIERIELPIGR